MRITLLLVFGIVIGIMLGFIIGYTIGYIEGIIDASTVYQITDIKEVLNITSNSSDYVIKELN